jgi:hypothetical protein
MFDNQSLLDRYRFYLFLGGTGFRTQSFKLAKQGLYHLNHTSSPFCSGYLELGLEELFAHAGLEP